MIYRILTDDPYKHDEQGRWRAGLAGAANCLSGIMWELNLPAPPIKNKRARFYFTERGWQHYGKAIVAEGIRRGHVVKVIRRKEPRISQIVYRDAVQMALLPPKDPTRRYERND